jgi:hypothetical protein
MKQRKIAILTEWNNEGKAIDAVLRRIEAREASLRLGDGWSPDDQQDPDKDRRVDYVCTIGKQLYAFEHTGIEPFENQIKIKMEVDNQRLFAPVMAHFRNGAPVGEHWELHTPVEASVGLSGAKIKQAQTGLIAWIQANATTLPVTRFGDRYPYSAQRESAPGVPFGFALFRWSVPPCGLSRVFWRREFISADLEKARRARLARVCDGKFGKLAKWKRDEGARSVLVMEETIYHRLITNLSPKRWPEPKPGGRMRPMKFFLSAASFLEQILGRLYCRRPDCQAPRSSRNGAALSGVGRARCHALAASIPSTDARLCR